MLKRTPLFSAHQELGGKLIEFGGWEMPVYYTSILDEHLTVRAAAGIFDISHMGEILVRGNQAEAFLNRTLTNNLCKLDVGQGQYTLMCNVHGGVMDDLYAYRIGLFDFLLIVNAARIETDADWLQRQLAAFAGKTDVELENASDTFGAVAVQGPRVKEFIDHSFPRPPGPESKAAPASSLRKNDISVFEFDGSSIRVARTGYTGEDGFEVVAPGKIIEEIWNKIVDAGRPFGLKPCGLGARDTLRTEMGYPLYGHELDETTSPIEAGLGFFVALDKGDFVGRDILVEQKEKGVTKKCIAFKMSDRCAPPRPHYPIWSAGVDAKPIGEVVSGTQSPSLGMGIGMGFVPPQFAKAGSAIGIEIRGKRFAAVTVPKPIYRRSPSS